jgi:hypothetical protein
MKVLVDRARVPLLVDDVEVDVRGASPAELGEDHRGADDLLLLPVEQHEHVLALGLGRDDAGEALVAGVDDLLDALPIVREVDRVEVARDPVELLLVSRQQRADFEASHRGGP